MSRSPLLSIFLIVLVDVLGLTIILPLLPFYAERFGASPAVIGLLVSTFAVCQLVSGPMLGQLSDRFGRKPMLMISQVGTLAGFTLLAFSRSLWMVFLARILDGATAGNLSIAQAYIVDVTAPENRAKAFGVIGIAFGIGFLIGPAMSGYMAHYSVQAPIFVAMALSATSILATAVLLPSKEKQAVATETAAYRAPATPAAAAPPPPGGERLGLLDWGRYVGFFKRPELNGLLFQFFAFGMSFSMFTAGFALFAERRLMFHNRLFGPREVGFAFAFSGFLGIFLQGGIIGRLVKRSGEAAVIRAGFFSLFSGYIVLAFAHGVGLLVPSAMLASFGTSALRPAITALVTRRVERHEQGIALGLTQSLTSLAQIVAPLLAGALIDRGYLTGWALMAGLFGGAGLLLRSGEVAVVGSAPSR